MKILHLCAKKFWDHKMSRVRFYSMAAIGRYPGNVLVKDGPGYPEFESVPQSVERHKPDLVVWYKPLDMPRYKECRVMSVIRYNEMWDKKWTTEEIVDSRSDIVICHHRNDMDNYPEFSRKTAHNPHCAEVKVFYPREKKRYDILFAGVQAKEIYPVRNKLLNILNKRFNVKVRGHPGYRIGDVEKQVEKYATELARAKIVIGCSSKYKYALAKYVEVGMSGTIFLADLPGENRNWYGSWVLHCSERNSDSRIIKKVKKFLKDGSLRRELSEKSRKYCLEQRTQEHYAERFMRIVEERI